MDEGATGAHRAPRPFGGARLLVWTLLVTLGGTLGLALPAAAYIASNRIDMPVWGVYPTVALAGALQGLFVGVAQAASLHRTVIAVPRAGWSLITMAGALVAWSLGMLPSTLAALGEPINLDSRRVLGLAVAGAAVLLFVVPIAQWLLLRRVLVGAWLWVLVVAGAILLALGAVWGVSQVIDTSLPLDEMAPTLALGGGVVALVFALVTGFGLWMMAPRPRRDALPARAAGPTT
ncbi:MAG TPA: hypothetical protein GXZ45_01355 [Propionibacterium sp.]|nr:hypothetical protein [Propionibacterium sp.]